MDKLTLRDAVQQLAALKNGYSLTVYDSAVAQFNALLKEAKSLYPDRVDIQAILEYKESVVLLDQFHNTVLRLLNALELRPPTSSGILFAQIKLPEDAPPDLKQDMAELAGALSLSLHKTALLLAGSIAETLLITRHHDKSERGPGLNKLVEQAREQRLFGKDTLRSLDNLVEYRDLIHPRAEKRNKTPRNEGRVNSAISALSLLCHELEDTKVRYNKSP